jgi:hypothetical protein
MATDNFYPKRALQMTRMIFFSQIAGSLAFMAVIYYISADNFIFSADLSNPLFLVLLFLSLIAIPGGYLLSRRKLRNINQSEPFVSKYPVFQQALIIKIASCNGVALFAAACLFITNNLFYTLFFLAALLIMILNYPSPEKIGREIYLTQSEIDMFY